MEESEIDDWYENRREQLEGRFAEDTQAKRENAKAVFERRYHALILEYQRRQLKLYRQKQRAARLRAPLVRGRARWQLLCSLIGAWWVHRRSLVKKWLLQRRVKRIIRDKSDL